MLHSELMAPFPLFTRSNSVCLDAPGLHESLFLSDSLGTLIKGAQVVRVLDAHGLREHIPVALAERQRVVVDELVRLRGHVLRARLKFLLSLGQGDFGLSDIRDSLDSDDTSSLSKLANRGHFSCLECHSACKLQGAILASNRRQLGVAGVAYSLLLDRLLAHCFIRLLDLGHELVDRVHLISRPGWHLC